MPFPHRNFILRPWLSSYAARAIKASAVINRCIADNSAVDISIPYHGSVYTHYRCVVPEPVARPLSANKTIPCITITIVDATVKAYMRPPVTGVKQIHPTVVTPIRWCPVNTGIGRGEPNTWHPIIAVGIIIGPIARLPQITINRAGRLHIYRQFGWSYPYRYTHAYLRRCLCYRKRHNK